MRCIVMLAFMLTSWSVFSQVEETSPYQRQSKSSLATTNDVELYDAIWDFDMIDKGNQDAFRSLERFRLVYDSIEAEHMQIFLTDLKGNIVGNFLDGKPEVTGALANFSFSTTPLKKGIYYLNVVADEKPREAVRVVVD